MKKQKNKPKIHEPYTKFKGWIRGNSLTYEDIAMVLNLSVGTVSQKVNGHSDFLISEIEKTISKYGATCDIFLS